MKKSILFLLLAGFILFQNQAFSQGGLLHSSINSGFYMKIGPSIPLGNFKSYQEYPVPKTIDSTHNYLGAKTGPALDMGFLIYLGPTFAHQFLRAGIDATFLTFNFQKTNPSKEGNEENWDYFYYFLGQKFGPVITINPIDRLMIDVSYKLNGYIARYYDNEWGKNFTQNEVSLSIRYRIMLFSMQYNWGKTRFNYFNSEKPTYNVPVNTLRIMIGIKI
ncbi:MAG: hypothetical protein Q8867_06200 [Bacteroidota bacterium]|nr:hypothetical protein [Bacteroidota bacterium]